MRYNSLLHTHHFNGTQRLNFRYVAVRKQLPNAADCVSSLTEATNMALT
jgi:hypothetical protein